MAKNKSNSKKKEEEINLNKLNIDELLSRNSSYFSPR